MRIKHNIYYSSAVEGDLGAILGSPHYSYRFAESKFMRLLSQKRLSAAKLVMPEFYSEASSLPASIYTKGLPHVHLIFRSTEQIRLLKFATNISCFAWEFPVLKDHTDIDEHPFLNQKRMLGLCDEVWVPCAYTRNTLLAHGLQNVHVVPAPIEIPNTRRTLRFDSLSKLGTSVIVPLYYNFLRSHSENRKISAEHRDTLKNYITARLRKNRDLRIYLSILNPEDFRKNLDALIRAFDLFSRDRDDVILILKVVTSSVRFDLLDVVANVIPNKLASGSAFSCDNIVIFNDFLSDVEMRYIFKLADYYICTSICEGQNLPLLEAMAHGVVPISTVHTAMADYLSAENSIVIDDCEVPNDIPFLAGCVAGRPFSIRRSRVQDILVALEKSSKLKPNGYETLASNARRTVTKIYSPEAVWTKILDRLANLGAVETRHVSHRHQK